VVGATVVVVAAGDVVVVVVAAPPVADAPGRIVVVVLDVSGVEMAGTTEEGDVVEGAAVVVGAAVVEVVDVVVVVGATVVVVVVVGATVVVVVVGDVAGIDVGVTLPVHGNGVPQLNTVELTFVTVRPIGLESVNKPDESVASRRSFVPATGESGPDGVKGDV
jgi:hypothetical protein